MTSKTKRILLTPGEPAGIGPDIIIHAAQKNWPAELVVVSDPDLLLDRAKQIGLPLHLTPYVAAQPATLHPTGHLVCLPVSLPKKTIPGQLNVNNAPYVLETLSQAVSLCLQHQAHALVTGPVHKEILNRAGIAFSGHTEFLAQACQVTETVMLFVLPTMKVALLTTHLPLKAVPENITAEKLHRTITTLAEGLKQHFNSSSPYILVAGLNPHAGEGGYLGSEEIDIIIPTLNKLKSTYPELHGPFSADTLFTLPEVNKADAILAMYHDQALPLVKYLSFGQSVNMTLGLPFIRTSVDHGTALEKAGTPLVNPSSLFSALELAISLQHR